METELKPREITNKRTITIEDSYWHFAKRFGEGKASVGIRKALYIAYKLQGQDTQPPSDGA
jgi:hypothetical protein